MGLCKQGFLCTCLNYTELHSLQGEQFVAGAAHRVQWKTVRFFVLLWVRRLL